MKSVSSAPLALELHQVTPLTVYGPQISNFVRRVIKSETKSCIVEAVSNSCLKSLINQICSDAPAALCGSTKAVTACLRMHKCLPSSMKLYYMHVSAVDKSQGSTLLTSWLTLWSRKTKRMSFCIRFGNTHQTKHTWQWLRSQFASRQSKSN